MGLLVEIAIPWMILGVIVVAGLAFSTADTCLWVMPIRSESWAWVMPG
jgi:hypothetical protein